MRKSTLFISAVLTTFVMAMLAGVVSAYQYVANNDQIAVQPQGQTVAVADSLPAPTEAAPVNFTPEGAAGLAAQVLGHDDVYSVEVTDLNGETVFLVTFSSGDLVYVSLDGQIRSIDKLQVETVVINSGSGSNQSGRSGGEREHEDEHEHDDD